MLINMHVKNLALIREADIDFFQGLNILTGETGAGKSILIDSMNIALGEKIPKEMLGGQTEPSLVELVFQVENPQMLVQLEQMEIFPEEGCVILSRKITNGRSIAKINGETVTVSKMKAAASLLVNIHGQHEHESLLNPKKHLNILDEFAKDALEEKKQQLKAAYGEYRHAAAQLMELNVDEESRLRELSFLEYEMKEIEDASLQEGEDGQLEGQYKKLRNSQKIMTALQAVFEVTDGAQGSVSDMLGHGVRELSSVSAYDEGLEMLQNELSEIDSLFQDFSRELSDYRNSLEFDEADFYEIEKRLDTINHLKEKYGKTIEDILEAYRKREEKHERLLHNEEEKARMEKKKAECGEQVEALCSQISRIRKKYAKTLSAQLKRSLLDLNFEDVQFEIAFSRAGHFNAEGYDEVEFMISTNPGEALKPLSKVASGGELSRIMLAIKTVMAQKDEVETLIFDEIDSGISGRTAQKVSEKLQLVSRTHQIMCITHLPQIASMADAHFLIEKTVQGRKTQTSITPLSEQEMVKELARMLGGAEITNAVLKNAEEMKRLAAILKEK